MTKFNRPKLTQIFLRHTQCKPTLADEEQHNFTGYLISTMPLFAPKM